MKSHPFFKFLLVTVPLVPTLAIAQTAVVTYGVQTPVPALGAVGLFTMGLLLASVAFIWVKRHPNAIHKLAISAITAGLLTTVGAGGWLVSNANAIALVTDYLLSQNDSPVSVTSFPATLTNDLKNPASIFSVDVSGCPGDTAITGTCEEGASLLGNGGSCSLDSVCAPVSGQQCDTGNDTHTSSPWVICDAGPDEAWISATSGGGSYNADLICQELGYDRAGVYGGNCDKVCGFCGDGTTSCAAPGTKTFDGNGDGASPGDYGLFLQITVHWTCVNDPDV